MYKVKTLNHVSDACKEIMNENKYQISDNMENPDAIFVRATDMHNYNFNEELLCIARAGIGVNTIPLDECSEKGIVVFNTPGGNANAVKELFLFGLSVASRDILNAMRWVYNYNDENTPVEVAMEKIKKQFAGPEYYTKSIGVIGTGNVGSLVANICLDLGMKVYAYDPYLSVNAAWRVSRHVERCDSLDSLLAKCDYITLHTPLTQETRGLINEKTISKMKDGVRIINYARGEVVDEESIINALHAGKVARYVSDFPTKALSKETNAILTPHLGGTTGEAEANCAYMAAKQMDDYLTNGNITNSVNLPDIKLDRSGKVRICIIHKNIPGMLTSLLPLFAKDHINIENMTNKSRGDYAYSVFDINEAIDEEMIKSLRNVDGVIKLRVL